MTYYRDGERVRLINWNPDGGYEHPPYGIQLGDIGVVVGETDSDDDTLVEFIDREGDIQEFYMGQEEIEPEYNDGLTPLHRKIKKLWEQSNYYKRVSGIENTNPSIQNGIQRSETVGSTLGRDLQHVAGLSQQAVSPPPEPYGSQLGFFSVPGLEEWQNYYAQQVRGSEQLSQQTESVQDVDGTWHQLSRVEHREGYGGAVANRGGQGSMPPNSSRVTGEGHRVGIQYGGISPSPLIYEIDNSIYGVPSSRFQREDD